jgi:hypothetical protein
MREKECASNRENKRANDTSSQGQRLYAIQLKTLFMKKKRLYHIGSTPSHVGIYPEALKYIPIDCGNRDALVEVPVPQLITDCY